MTHNARHMSARRWVVLHSAAALVVGAILWGAFQVWRAYG